jgi:DNA-binding NarL/FixJ family response regulator
MPSAETVRAQASVLLVDDHALLRTGVANIINQEADLRVVAEAGNGVEALEAYERFKPDVTLLDLRMPVMEGVEVVRRLRERDPRALVIVLTTYDTDEEISRALKAGAKAYVLKDISADDLVTCIRDVLAGKTYLAPRPPPSWPRKSRACSSHRHQRAHAVDGDGLASEKLAFGPAPRL